MSEEIKEMSEVSEETTPVEVVIDEPLMEVETTETEPAVEEPAVEEKAAEDPAEPAARPQQEAPRSRTRRNSNDATDYMGDSFTLLSTVDGAQKEIVDIERIIANNNRVSTSGRGEYQYILAMMTGNDETRENGSHDKLLATSVYAVQVFPHDDKPDDYGTLRLVFDGEDFTAYSGITESEKDTEASMLRRQRSYTNHAQGSMFQCVPVKVVRNKVTNKVESVICSRAFAMEKMQDRFFFGEHARAAEGSEAIAYVMAVDDNGVRVECMGIETRINRGQLTSQKFLLRAGDVYSPGMKIPVVVRKLDVDKEKRTISDIQLSGVDYEIKHGLVKSVTEFDLTKKPHELAHVISVSPNYYIVRLVASGIIGIIEKNNCRNAPVSGLKRGDRVSMEIVRVSEKYNRVFGNCYKVNG